MAATPLQLFLNIIVALCQLPLIFLKIMNEKCFRFSDTHSQTEGSRRAVGSQIMLYQFISFIRVR